MFSLSEFMVSHWLLAIGLFFLAQFLYVVIRRARTRTIAQLPSPAPGSWLAGM